MLLIAAAVVWLLIGLYVTITPRLGFEARRNAQYDLLAFGALGALTAGFFWQLLFTPNAHIPAGGGDLAGFLYPTYHFAQEWLTRGVVPLWNPYIFGGMPFVGDIQSALFYPLNLFTYLLSNPLQYRDLEYLAIFHFYLAGAGMFALLRYGRFTPDGRPLSRFAALAGAIAFAFSDLFVTHFGNLNLIASAAWLPLIFLFFSRALDALPATDEIKNLALYRRTFLFVLLSAVTLAISFFAGHIQPFLFILLTLALYAGYSILVDRARWRGVALAFVITLGIGISLSAVTLLTALEMAGLSVRSAFTYADAAQFSLPPIELVGMLAPGFFGRGPANAWGPWARVEVGYLGIFPLLLAALAIVLRRNSKAMFFLLVSTVGLLLALGGYAILHGWLFQFVPGFGQLRAPARFILMLDFGLAVLAAIGFDALVSPMTEAVRRTFRRTVRTGAWIALILAVASGALALSVLILGQGQDPALFQRIANAANSLGFFILLLGFSFALLIVAARNWLSARLWSILALALIFFDLFSLGAYMDVGNSDPTLGYQRADIVEFLKTTTGLARIDSRTDVEGLWRPDTGLLHRVQDVYGDNPLVLNNFNTYWETLGGRDKVGYAFLNVKYVLTRRGTPMPSNFTNVFEGGGGITVWENKCLVPRAWIVYNSKVVDDQQIALVPLAAETCGLPEIPLPLSLSPALTGEGARELVQNNLLTADPFEVTGYGPNEIVGTANAQADGYVIFSETFVPGWRAFVDGQEAPVVRANYLFRAVPIPSGQHQVRMIYDPLSFKLGAIISGLVLVSVIVGFGWLWLSRVKRSAKGKELRQ